MKRSLAIMLSFFLVGCNDYYYLEHKPEIIYRKINPSAATLEEISVNHLLEIGYSKKYRRDVSPTKTAKLTEQEYNKLDELIHKADVFSMQNEYLPEQHLLGMYTLTLEIKEKEKHKIINIEGDAKYSKELGSVMEYLIRLKDEKLDDTKR